MTYCKPIAVIITVLMKSCCTYISDCGIIAVLGGCMYGDSIDNGKLRKRDGKSNPLILRTTSTLFLSSPFACRQGGYIYSQGWAAYPISFPSACLYANSAAYSGDWDYHSSMHNKTGLQIYGDGVNKLYIAVGY